MAWVGSVCTTAFGICMWTHNRIQILGLSFAAVRLLPDSHPLRSVRCSLSVSVNVQFGPVGPTRRPTHAWPPATPPSHRRRAWRTTHRPLRVATRHLQRASPVHSTSMPGHRRACAPGSSTRPSAMVNSQTSLARRQLLLPRWVYHGLHASSSSNARPCTAYIQTSSKNSRSLWMHLRHAHRPGIIRLTL